MSAALDFLAGLGAGAVLIVAAIAVVECMA